MRIEIRGDAAQISGYVNATEKKSRPVITPHGKVVEEIEPGAFQAAIDRGGDISLTLDHDKSHVYASTSDGSLELYEDDIGLHASVLVKDRNVIELAKQGKIRGWSFGMYNVQDELEHRADDLPLRKIKAMDLDHVSLIAKMQPCYSATSVEVRAGTEVDVETRATEQQSQITGVSEEPPFFDNTPYRERVNRIRKEH